MTGTEGRHPIPGRPGYETDGVDFYGIDRVITKSDGVRYTVKGRKLKISAHRPSGLPVVKLSNGHAGAGRWCFVHLLLAATFGANQHQSGTVDNVHSSSERPSSTSESAA